MGFLFLPLQAPTPQWHTFQYSKTPPNSVSFSKGGLSIVVNKSASPLFFDLEKKRAVQGVQVRGFLSGLPKQAISTSVKEQKDDLPFRLGFIEPSEDSPSWFQKLFLPEWLKKILEFFPNQGVKKVHFLTLSPTQPVGTVRLHPKSHLIEEKVVLRQETAGHFEFKHRFLPAISASAIWIQADGDDTQSQYTLTLTEIAIETDSK